MTKEEKSEYNKIYSKLHPEKNREKANRWRNSNKEKAIVASRKYRSENPEYMKNYYKKYRDENLEKEIERQRIYHVANAKKEKAHKLILIKTLDDLYIAEKLKLSVKILRKYPELIEAKRTQLKIKRLIKNQTA